MATPRWPPPGGACVMAGAGTMKARPTTYKGIRMRSRTEALFAASLEGSCTWVYEPECFADETGQYLPDFLVSFTEVDRVYYEIKPTMAQVAPAARRMEIILSTHPKAHLDVTIPQGIWPDVEFISAARRSGLKGKWHGPAFTKPADVARAQFTAKRT